MSQDKSAWRQSDDNTDLAAAAKESYKPAPSGVTGTVQSWYKPVYDYDTKDMTPEERAKNPRYCGGRLKRWEFILLHVFIIVNVLLVIFIPLTYFVLAPNYLQYRIDNLGKDNSAPPVINNLNLGELKQDNLQLGLNVELAPLFPFPINAGIGNMNVRVLSMDTDEIMNLEVPAMDFWINQPLKLNFNLSVNFNQDNQAKTKALVEKFSTQGLKNYKIMARFNTPIKLFGLTIYTALPLHKEIIVGDVDPNLSSVKKLLPSGSSVPSKPTGAALRAKFKASDILDITGSFSIVWSDFAVSMRDEGMSIIFGVSFENPLPVTVAQITGLDMYLAVEKTNVVQFVIDRLALSDGLQDFTLKMDINFIAPAIDTTKVPDAISTASHNFANTGGFALALVGPIKIKGAGFVETITSPISFDFSVKDTLDSFKSTNGTSKNPLTDTLGPLLSESGVKSILGNSSIAIKFLADRITTDAGLALPVIAAIPKHISFPYTSTVSIYGAGQKAIQIDVGALDIQRLEKAITANTSVVVLPTNTEQAATGLAQAINPVLAANPVNSFVGIKDLAFFTEGKVPFKWCTVLFANQVVDFGIPAIDKKALLSSSAASAAASVPLTDLATIRTMDVAQTTDRPGFNAKGAIDVAYPAGLPSLVVDVGFFHIDATVESTTLLGLELPNGLKFFPQTSGTAVDGDLVFGRDPQVPVKVQHLADVLLNDGTLADAAPSYAGVAGISFGASAGNKIITFSKIIVDVDHDTLSSVLSSLGSSGSSSSLLKPGMVKVQSGDVAVNSATAVTLASTAQVENPLPNIAISLGSVNLNALLDDQRLLGLNVNPLSIGRGVSNLNLGVGLDLATGANGLDAKVATLVNAFLNKDSSLQMKAGVTNFKLFPPGVTSGPAVIDQFSTITFRLPVGPLLAPNDNSAGSPLDISAIMPGKDLLKQLNPSIKFVQLDAVAGGSLKTGADAGYTNPLPVSAKLPYLKLTLTLAGKDSITLDIAGVELARQQGTIQPRLNVFFVKDPTVPDNIASLLNNFLDGKLAPSVGVKSILFGSAANNANNLLGLVNVDVTSYAEPYAEQGKDLAKTLNDMVDKVLSGGLGSSNSNSTGIITINGPSGTSLAINTADIAFQPASVIAANIAGAVGVPFPVEVNIPYFAAAADVDELNAVNLFLSGLGLQGNGNLPLKLGNKIAINDVPELADLLGKLTKAFIDGIKVDNKLNAGRIYMGVSDSDRIEAFSKIAAGLPLQKLLDAVSGKSGSGGLDIEALKKLINKFNLTTGKLGLNAEPNHSLRATADAGFSNPFPVTVSGLGYIGLNTGIDTTGFLQLNLPGFNIASGTNKVNVAAGLFFPSAEEIQDKVASFALNLINNFGKTTEMLTASEIKFGVSDKDYIKALSKAFLGIESSKILNNDTLTAVLGSGSVNTTALLDMVGLKSASAELHPSTIIDAALSANLTLPSKLDAAVNMPYFSAGTYLSSIPFANIAVNGFKIAGAGTNDLSLQSQLDIHDSDTLATAVAEVAEDIVEKRPLTAKIGGGEVLFGIDNTPANVVDTFKKVKINLDLDPIYKTLTSSNGTSIDIEAIIKKLGLKLSDINVNAAEKKVIAAGLGAGFTSDFQLTLKGLGYVGAVTGLDKTPLVQLTASGLALQPGANNLKINSELFFPSSQDIQQKVAKFADNLINLGVGKTPENFTATGAGFGFDKEHRFKFLEKAMIGIKSSDIINPDTVNKTLSALGLGSGSVNTTALFKMIGLKSAVVDFHPTTVIDAGVNANLTLPDSLTAAVNMPFFGAGSYVADVPFAGLKVNGFKISGAGTNDLNLQSQVDIHDTPDLATVFEKLAAAFSSNQPFNTKIGGGEVLFGLDSSEANVIDSFGKVKINLDLDDLYNKIKTANVTSSIDIDGILKDLGLKLSNVDVKTAPKKTIQAAIGASFNSGFQITLNGLGYIAATTGIDTIPLVQLTASGVGLRPGQNDLKLSSDLFFPSSSAIQNKVATFVDNLINLGVGKTVEEFTANGAGFGFDKDHYFKFLEKALVRIKSSDIINPTTVNKTLTALGLGGDFKFDPKKLLDMVDISKLHLDGSVVNDNKVPAAIGVTLKNISLTASASLGYAGFGAMINDDPLLDFDLTAPLTVQSKDNNIALDLANTLKFYDSEIVQTEVAVVVSSIVNDKPVPGKVGGGGVKFGSDSSAENVIDSFATVKVKVDPNPYIPSIKNATIDLINTVLNSNSSAGVDISNVSVDAIDFVNLQIDAAAKLKGIKGDYYINVPYAQAGLTWDGVDLAVNKLQKVLLKDGTFTATIILSIVNPDLVISQQIVDIIGDVVFHRNNTYPYKAGGNYIGFGTAEDKQIKTFNKVNVGLLINDLVQGATKYVNNTRPLELIDIQAKITPDEIFAPTSIKKIGFPITIKAPINAMVTYRIPNADGYDEKKVVDVIFDNWHLDDVEHPRLIVHMIPDLGGDTAAAVSDDIVNLLTFNDYAARAYLGGLTIGSSNPDGSAFVALAFGFFRAPDLYLFNPITISVLPNWQIITKGGIELPIKIGFSFPNTGPLHLDIGSVGIDVVDGANKLLTIASPGDIIIKNNVEGGDTNGGAGNPTHGELDIILPFTDLNPAVILKLLKDLLTKTSELGIKLRFERDGKDLVWVSTVARQLDPNSIKKLIPFIAVILSHIKFEVLGLDITQNAIYQEILKLVQKWINEHFPAAASSFIGMPATLPSVNGTTATNLTARADNVIQSKLTIIGY